MKLDYFDLSRLSGQVAVITGGSQGIGLSLAEGFGNAGCQVVIVNRKANRGEEAVRTLREKGISVVRIPADVSVKSSVEEMVEKVLECFGKIDILVNNAGAVVRKKAIETTENDWKLMMDVNLKGVFLCCQAVGKVMMKQKKGKIINISSAAVARAVDSRAVYCASKAGVSQLTKALALEWGSYNINVNAIGPGVIRTPINADYLEKNPDKVQAMIQKIPCGRLGRPEDLVGAVIFFAARASDYISGQTIYVDGGYLSGDTKW